MTRLNKYIASSGICSRRNADDLITAGKVAVNGKIITEFGFYIREKDKVTVEGKLIKPLSLEYYRFYKPAGYITTQDDEKGRKTIYDIIPKELKHLKPVGRLDKDSTGLLILTNDGELINKMTHPSVKVPKVYTVTINLPGEHFVLNSLAAWAVGRVNNVPPEKIVEGLKNFEMSKLRMDIKEVNGYKIINDTYNAGPESMNAILDTLSKLSGGRKIAVLADMLELGEMSQKIHFEIVNILII